MTSIMTGFAGVCLLTEKEAATRLRMSVGWLRKRRSRGLSPRPIYLGRAVRYSTAELDAAVTVTVKEAA